MKPKNRRRILPDANWMLLRDIEPFMAGISRRTLRRWCETGQIPASRRGGRGRWYVDVAALRDARTEYENAPVTPFDIALGAPDQSDSPENEP